jgi:hypothetical protein
MIGLTEYFIFYNKVRLHQSLNYRTPDTVYQLATGGGAIIVDKYNQRKKQGSAFPLQLMGYPLNLDAILS